MASYLSGSEAYNRENDVSAHANAAQQSPWANKYRGVSHSRRSRSPPPLSVSPNSPIDAALMAAYERDYTHLTVISATSRSLLGYLSIPRLKELIQSGTVNGGDPVSAAMQRFNRKRGIYKVITMETPLEELEQFFESQTGPNGDQREKQQFAVVTDAARKFVLGVATKADLEEFVKRRP
ncbi:uncharacterized protein N7469_005278 [Penicillium citrinum]|uniref:Cystathionine beta-synthase n=1 Tax=Penicillium citrinum TaxID=5077 RepID=A0A9W9TP62_PENCI|nr:uncharacterized protein N7469_005278 [Penicillium citrinum]KAJ5233512.1 hypothetical protein N7469_005278 [Penicillium citrinum]